MVSTKAFKGEKRKLFVLHERTVDFDVAKIDAEIRSSVLGSEIIVTPPLIAETIGCQDDGLSVIKFDRPDSPFITKFGTYLYDSYDRAGSASTLKPLMKKWHEVATSNILPRIGNMDLITLNEKHLLLFLSIRSRVSLPLTIFDYLKTNITASRSGRIYFIPYGRVISLILVHLGVVKKTRTALSVSWGKRLHPDEHESDTEPEKDPSSDNEGQSGAAVQAKRQKSHPSSSNP
ncbi:hypothetical protein A2U01_0006072 [Trifolium medium]|uniref:Uncharacterized protein n=1 Tax=Trifolium medium TaxID=97028 RepID=A0A392MEN5_9FABA|nr:hypothetical protein [Trifolium medium]